MKKLILLMVIGSSLMAFDECKYHSDQLLKDMKTYQKAMKLKLKNEVMVQIKMLKYQSERVMMTCGENSEQFKIAEQLHKLTKGVK